MSTGAATAMGMARSFRRVLRDLEPTALSPRDAAALAAELASTEKACAAARLLTAAHAIDCGAHEEDGVPDPTAWLARQGGTTGKDARQGLDLARSLSAYPKTKDALLAGEISIPQAKEIAKAAAESPDAEDELLSLARSSDLSRFRDALRERTLSSTPPDELHRRQVAARRFRHWRDGLGMVCFGGALPPETGIPFVTRIEREARRRHQAAKQEGRSARFEASAADALVALMNAESKPGGRIHTDLVIVCDLYAWRRGHAHDGETCHLVGGGPIPVDLAKQLAEDAFLKVVLHDGKEIQRVRHHGRRYTAELKTALDLGPVPSFKGRACRDCTRTYGLEYDHTDPVAHTGPTSLRNVVARCYPCHQAKTERDRRAGLLGKRAKARGPGPPPGRPGGPQRRPRAGPGPRRGSGQPTTAPAVEEREPRRNAP